MIEVETSRIIGAEPDDVLSFCFDPIAYQAIDGKITRVHTNHRGLGRRLVECSQRVGSIRLPRQVLYVTIEPGMALTFEQVGGRLAQWLLRYRAEVLVDQLEEGCIVSHRYLIGFRQPIGWLIDPLVGRRLRTALDEEMDRLAEHFDSTVVELDSRR